MTKPLPSDDLPAEQCARSECAACGWWRLPLLLAVVLAAILAFRGSGIRVGEVAEEPADIETTAEVAASGETVSLVIEFGETDERREFTPTWRAGMTVANALAAARQQTDDQRRLGYAVQGSGQSAFLTDLAGVANEGAGGRNWTYTVNGKLADRSFAVYELEPGDQVLWSFKHSE